MLDCGAQRSLSDSERAKLHPFLIELLNNNPQVEKMISSSYRADGSKQYEVIIRTDQPDELKKHGIQISSVFGDVVVARVTKDELRKIVSLSSVRSVEAGTRNVIQ